MIRRLVGTAAGLVALLWAALWHLQLRDPELRAGFERDVVVMDVVRGTQRWVTARIGPGPVPDDGVRIVGNRCDCATLGPDEHPLWPTPLVDGDRRRRSLDHDDYYARHELWDLPVSDGTLRAWFVARVTNVRHRRLLETLLDRGGFDLLEDHGFATDEPEYIDGVHVVVARHRRTRRTYVGLRGTTGLADVRRDLDAGLVPAERFPGRVHRGFWSGAELADRMLTVPLPPDTVFTGHSLGAAMATLLYLRLEASVPAGRAVAFAPPVIGDVGFEVWARARADRLVRVVVPGEELSFEGYRLRYPARPWPGTTRQLPMTRRAGGFFHLPINYTEGVLRACRVPAEPWLERLPACVAHRLDCYADDGVRHLPACVGEPGDCRDAYRSDLERMGRRPGLAEASLDADPVLYPMYRAALVTRLRSAP